MGKLGISKLVGRESSTKLDQDGISEGTVPTGAETGHRTDKSEGPEP